MSHIKEEIVTSTKYIKKIHRKQKRIQKKLFEETCIKSSDIPTRNIVICNSGLVNGLTQETVLDLFVKYGPIEQVIMPPEKSYCFVVFDNVIDSSIAFDAIHGREMKAQNNGALYLSFTEGVPNVSSNWQNPLPPGLIVYENFVTELEEIQILACVNWNDDTQGLKYRQVKHFGYEFLYGINNVDLDKPLIESIPPECGFLTERLMARGYLNKFVPDQLTVNKYLPGQGIPPHIDTHSAFEDTILSLSLGSLVVMEFKNPKGVHVPVLLPRRSLLVMSGEARYAWTHGIIPRVMDTIPSGTGLTVQVRETRTSFTFRRVLRGECHCSFQDQCDSARSRFSTMSAMEDSTAAKLEVLHVHQVYEEIATHFSETRHKPWPNVLQFVQSFNIGDILIDIGCGNGKYLGQNPHIFDLGCDRSSGLLEVCRDRGFQVNASDCLFLPYRSNIANGCISVAVIHHLANQERRLRAIQEMIRILVCGGRALIYVWAKNQAKDEEKSSYLKQDRKNRKSTVENVTVLKETSEQFSNQDLPFPVHTNRTQFAHQDVLVPWKLKKKLNKDNFKPVEETFLRYYHTFEEGELDSICKQLPNVTLLKTYYDQGNWCVVLEKNS